MQNAEDRDARQKVELAQLLQEVSELQAIVGDPTGSDDAARAAKDADTIKNRSQCVEKLQVVNDQQPHLQMQARRYKQQYEELLPKFKCLGQTKNNCH